MPGGSRSDAQRVERQQLILTNLKSALEKVRGESVASLTKDANNDFHGQFIGGKSFKAVRVVYYSNRSALFFTLIIADEEEKEYEAIFKRADIFIS